MTRARRCAGESGFAGGLDGLIFGLLIFVVGTLLAASAWAVVDTKLAADTAARQAARTFVEAPNSIAAAGEATLAADRSLAAYGRTPGRAVITLLSGRFARCSLVTIQVRYPSPLLELPLLGVIGSGVPVTARHSEVVDPFRTGLPGVAACH